MDVVSSTPDDHFGAAPNCGVIVSCRGGIRKASGNPSVSIWIISPAGVQSSTAERVTPAPDDHFIAGPDRRMKLPASGRISRASGCPAVCGRIVFSACVLEVLVPVLIVKVTAPDDHFGTGPDGRVIFTCRGST